VKKWVRQQQRWSLALDRALVKERFRTDGNADFMESFAPSYLRPGLRVYDMGGGKQPFISPDLKKSLGLSVIGVDIDQNELDRAPAGAYDSAICADICDPSRFPANDADLVISQTVLEHVPDVARAFDTFAKVLRPGGQAVLFAPSRNAIFARLNLLLPEDMKRKVMFSIFPHKKRDSGFPAYYDRCTLGQFRAIAAARGLELVEKRAYYRSGYFSFFAPLYLLWRLWVMTFYLFAREQAAESFCLAVAKPAASPDKTNASTDKPARAPVAV